MTRMPKPETSRWRAQLGALGLDADARVEDASREEARKLSALRLPPLELPAPSRPERRWSPALTRASLAAVAATLLGLALVLVPTREDDVLRVKGGARVTVWWERDGDARPLGEGGPLAAGDRVRAEVQAPDAGVAYWLVRDGAGKALVDEAFVTESALPVKAGEKAAFARSVRLVGDAVGETLVVVVCRGQEMTRADVASVVATGALPERCAKTEAKLRP